LSRRARAHQDSGFAEDLLSVTVPGGPEPVGLPAVVCRLGIRSV
jgi:hypothetical protein